MTDYISRADAIETVKQRLYQSAMNNMSTIMTADKIFADIADNRIELWLNEVPSADAVQGWIPCSERLPSAEDCPMDCMVTRRSKYVGNYTDMAVAEADGTWTHEDWKAITINGNATCISTKDADIIAWKPLPKPYKGGDSE